MTISNNPPVTVELTEELVEFLIQSCVVNISIGLQALNAIQSEELREKLKANIEKFKTIREAMEKAK